MDYENKSKSDVWKHFLQEEKRQTPICNYITCKKILQTKGGSTKGL